ncbi:MAG: ATP-NAD kinase family protein [Candidatus Verstraetearchaeota archaeon]|nr:ATP-NAD kinase family protein [Candidatus Verstraetearchaeota archaeon]
MLSIRRAGLIVNPVAGMGGAVGLKGTDGLAERALHLGAVEVSIGRAARFLEKLRPLGSAIDFLTCPGQMGEEAFRRAALPFRLVRGMDRKERTTNEDTKLAAAKMLEEGVEVIAFCGGDGTARDVLDAVGEGVPVIGIPAGVKMHSGVFAVSPEAAAWILVRFLWGELPLKEAEVADVDEEAFRQGRVSSKIYGYMSVPYDPERVQGMKLASQPIDDVSENALAIAEWIVERMERGVTYVLGPGSTVKKINQVLGIEGSQLGVDIVKDKGLVAADASEEIVFRNVRDGRARIIVSPIGNQGFIFGRGNQQISPRVIRAVGRENVVVIATREKLRGTRVLRVDTGDPELDALLLGPMRVVADYNFTKMMIVAGTE